MSDIIDITAGFDDSTMEAELKLLDNKKRRIARGLTFKILRDARELSQAEMAKLLKVSRVTYGNFERGRSDVTMRKMDSWLTILEEGSLSISL